MCADSILSTLSLSLSAVELTFIPLWNIEHFLASLSPNNFSPRGMPLLTHKRDGLSIIRIIPCEVFEGTVCEGFAPVFVFKGISCTPDWPQIHSV